ncbi:MAG: right-handed parallel beta-helix repeat-containing protein [Candidatus Binatia bacterium]
MSATALLPGDYTETHSGTAAVRITKPLRLIAANSLPDAKVRILAGAGQRDGILVEPADDSDPKVDGVEINGFTVEGFPNNGIWLRYVNNFTIENNVSVDNLENGIWPTLSANGLVKKNVAYGSQDSALWVEGSENVRVIENDLHHSPTGLEITVSNEVTAEKNDVHHNTVGVGLYHPAAAGLPPLEPIERNGYWRPSTTGRPRQQRAQHRPAGVTGLPAPARRRNPGARRRPRRSRAEQDREQRVLRHCHDRLLRRRGRVAARLHGQPPGGRRYGAGEQPVHRQHAAQQRRQSAARGFPHRSP